VKLVNRLPLHADERFLEEVEQADALPAMVTNIERAESNRYVEIRVFRWASAPTS